MSQQTRRLIAQLAVLTIMIILLGPWWALVVVNALKNSPWATFTLAMTIPIALLLGVYLRFSGRGGCWKLRWLGGPGAVRSCCGAVGGGFAALAKVFTLGGVTLAYAIIAYGFAASAAAVCCCWPRAII